ncbi:MAG: hypothetical protein MUC87_09090 [Bacteroidia bacterium]|jgi:TRAP-type C4-dicarboxylate transport system permease small subunit|nr:hypothetical protein [Bacteroidia bacterium]
MRDRLLNNRLKTLAAIFVLLISYPLVSIASRNGEVMGIPRLFIYLMVVWLGVIALLFLLIELYKRRK